MTRRRHLFDSIRRATAVVIATVCAGTGAAAAAPQAAAQEKKECPAIVVIAGRGSGERPAAPATFSGGGYSNGWEGGMLQRMMRRLDMAQTSVIGLDRVHYEARTLDFGSGTSAMNSAMQGGRGAVAVAQDFENATGCRPFYLLAGYSQGAAVAQFAERPFALSGRLLGSVFLGDPFLAPGERGIIGARGGGRGIFAAGGLLGFVLRSSPAVIDFCQDFDPVCDSTPTVKSAVHGVDMFFARHNTYFAGNPQFAADEAQVIGRINGLLDEGRARYNAGQTRGASTPLVWNVLR